MAPAQNTAPTPTADPSAPNTSGKKVWLALTIEVRTPTASPAREGGAVRCSRLMAIGVPQPTLRPIANAAPIISGKVLASGNTV